MTHQRAHIGKSSGNITQIEALSFIKKCEVYFPRSVIRIIPAYITENPPPMLPGDSKTMRVCDTPFFWQNARMWSMQISAETTPYDALEEIMSCADFAQCHASKMGCNAGSWLESAEIVKWPHLMLFEMSNFHVDLSINLIEECFSLRNKKILLRGAILGDGGHFTTSL